ncbi:hypothetical protein ACFLXN_02770 [Chloroflexota bacterium]
MDRYKIVFTSDQIRNTCACGIDPKIPLRDTERILKQNADEVCENGRYRFGNSYIRMISFGIEVDGKDERADKVITLLDENWKIVKI